MVNGVGVLVFDMDGVLVDVRESYREAIIQTVGHFTGQQVSKEAIQDYKNRGGYNNDWILSRKICEDMGVQVTYEAIVDQFNEVFLNQGLIHRERWLPENGLLERLASGCELAIFTGRNLVEVEITLRREGYWQQFLLITSDDVEHEKPAPDGLLKIAALRPGKALLYVGDTVDDARASKAAGVPFVGICAADSLRHDEIVALLKAEGALAVLENVNEIG